MKQSRDNSKNCANCGTLVERKPSFWKRIKGLACCSKTCRAEYLRTAYLGKDNPNFSGKDLIHLWFHNKQKAIEHSASQRNLEFSLKTNDLYNQFKKQNGLCHYSGIPLQFSKTENWKDTKCAAPDILSVDRIDSEKGYTADNIVLCCVAINKMKGNSTVEEIQSMLTYIAIKNTNSCKIKFKKLTETAMSPIKANLGDVGYDLHVDSFTDDKDFFTVKTGISLSMPIGWFSEVYARSSLHKKGLMLYNSVGIIDQSYQGEIILKLFKTRPDAVLTTGDKVAQIIPKKYAMVELEEVQEFDLQTERGSQGFGSTGK